MFSESSYKLHAIPNPLLCPVIRNEMGRVCSTYRGRGARMVFVRKPDRKEKTWKNCRRWEDDIKTNLQEMGRGLLQWIILAPNTNCWRALVNSGMNFRVP